MPSSIDVTQLGDVSPDKIAIWISGVALIILLGRIIGKTKGSGDLRFLTYCVLVGVFGILGFAYFSPDRSAVANDDAPAQIKKAEAPHQPTADGDDPPITTRPQVGDEYPDKSPDNSQQSAKPAPLQSPHARSGVADQPNGS